MTIDRDQDHTNDDPLFAELRGHFARTDPVPDVVNEAARAAFEVRDLDAQLAELLRDSAVEEKELSGVRGIGQRLLTFGRGDRFVEVDVSSTGERRDLSGYVVPAAPGTLRVEHSAGVADAPIDEQGRFRLSRIPRGPVRLRVEAPASSPLVTPWLPI